MRGDVWPEHRLSGWLRNWFWGEETSGEKRRPTPSVCIYANHWFWSARPRLLIAVLFGVRTHTSRWAESVHLKIRPGVGPDDDDHDPPQIGLYTYFTYHFHNHDRNLTHAFPIHSCNKLEHHFHLASLFQFFFFSLLLCSSCEPYSTFGVQSPHTRVH